jgi:hypothetical protein
MPESTQKSWNSFAINRVPLSVIMLLGTPNLYTISLMNSTALAAVMEAAGFTLTHFMNLFTMKKICVNSPLAFLKRPTKSSPHVEKRQVMVWSTTAEMAHVSGGQKTGNLHTDVQ